MAHVTKCVPFKQINSQKHAYPYQQWFNEGNILRKDIPPKKQHDTVRNEQYIRKLEGPVRRYRSVLCACRKAPLCSKPNSSFDLLQHCKHHLNSLFHLQGVCVCKCVCVGEWMVCFRRSTLEMSPEMPVHPYHCILVFLPTTVTMVTELPLAPWVRQCSNE